jgi:hypothetical protein
MNDSKLTLSSGGSFNSSGISMTAIGIDVTAVYKTRLFLSIIKKTHNTILASYKDNNKQFLKVCDYNGIFKYAEGYTVKERF